VNNQVGYSGLVFTRPGVKNLIVEVKRPDALAWIERSAVQSIDAHSYRTGRSGATFEASRWHRHSQIFGREMKLFEPKTMCTIIAVRDREERQPGLVWPCGSRSM